ncbi:class I SAM-dependent methyltransferase [Streptomyces subrutilus]|uniref:class I SAM-dependent methyltransferase n=1 Tax=Streptomyces subrutilus TaxID=36818 RepID=UPI00343AB101
MTETSPPHAVRAPSGTVAVDHARLAAAALARRPLDRAMLAAFAECVRGGGAGEGPGGGARAVADLGCGPGRITAHLDGLGVRAFGVDLSPAMVAVARRTYPGLRFEVGSMAALDVADGVLGGVLAWNSTVHTPPPQLPAFFAEFARVLAPGGHALIAFRTGEATGGATGEARVLPRPATASSAAPDVHRAPPDRIAGLLAAAGLAEVARLVREPDAGECSPQGFLLARRARGDAPAG